MGRAPRKSASQASKKTFAEKRFANVTRESLQDGEKMYRMADSASTSRNIRSAKRILKEFCIKIGAKDPVEVSPESPNLIMNLLYTYCRCGTPQALTDDTMGGLIQGLRHVYSEAGHRGTWVVDSKSQSASGNPLHNNEEIKQLRALNRVFLIKQGRGKRRARPMSVALVCEHATRYWFGFGNPIDCRDVLLQAIMVIGLNVGLRYDEVSKMKIEDITVTPGVRGTGSILLNITVNTKNSTTGREYVITEWPGNSRMRHSVLIDPFVGLLSWMSMRGNRPGYLFCDVTEKNIIVTNKFWSTTDFKTFLRSRLRMCGVGLGNLYSGHSLKRGCVQLYRSLGLRDEHIMQVIQMRGVNAYMNYCAYFNDCAPPDLPRFNKVGAFLQHANTLRKEIENDEDPEISDEDAV